MAKKLFTCKLAVLGDGDVGKTALILRFRSGMFEEEFDPTIEDSYTINKTIDFQPCEVEILDTAGADEYPQLRERGILSNEGFILVYSISSKPSFERIQGLYDQIRKVKKSPHSHPSAQVPIILVGNKADTAEREVSPLEGKEMAQILGCRFLEASAKDGGNVEETFHIIVWQLKEKALLDDLVDSLPQWHNLVENLEGKISSSQIKAAKANLSAVVPVQAKNKATEQPDARNLSTLQLPRTLQRQRSFLGIKIPILQLPRTLQRQRSFLDIKLSTLQLPRTAQRQRSFPDINGCQPPSRSQSPLVSSKRKANSVDCNISQPSEHPGRLVFEGNFDSQTAFEDIINFLSTLRGKVGEARHAATMVQIKVAMADNEGTPTAEMVDGKALCKCQKLCEDAAFEVLRYGEARDKIQEMKNEFVRMIETIAKLRQLSRLVFVVT